MTRASKLLLVPILLAQAVFFFYIAQHRFVDGDEGFYLLASRLVLLHKIPYLDFAYVQAPLLLYAYAAWMKLTAITWHAARSFSALITTALGTLLYLEVCRLTQRCLAGLAAVVLFASTTLVFACYPSVHPFGLSALFLFAAYMAVVRRPALVPLALGGLFLGLAVDTRSYLALLLPVFLCWIARPRNLRAPLAFTAGFLAGLLPCLVLFALAPRAFFFNNLGYHALRTGSGLIGAWLEKLTVLLMFFLGGPQGNGLQNSILFFVSLAFVFSLFAPGDAPRLAFLLALAIAAVSLLPTPVYPGYFSLCLPFLLVSAVSVAARLLVPSPAVRPSLTGIAAAAVLFLLYLAIALPDLRKYLVTGERIATVGHARDKSAWRIETITQVSRAIDRLAPPGEAVTSFWPGYLFQSHALPLPGLENDFVLPIAARMTVEERARYHVLSLPEVEATLAAHTPRIVVFGNQNRLAQAATADTLPQTLTTNGYTLVDSIGGAEIYVYSSVQ